MKWVIELERNDEKGYFSSYFPFQIVQLQHATVILNKVKAQTTAGNLKELGYNTNIIRPKNIKSL